MGDIVYINRRPTTAIPKRRGDDTRRLGASVEEPRADAGVRQLAGGRPAEPRRPMARDQPVGDIEERAEEAYAREAADPTPRRRKVAERSQDRLGSKAHLHPGLEQHDRPVATCIALRWREQPVRELALQAREPQCTGGIAVDQEPHAAMAEAAVAVEEDDRSLAVVLDDGRGGGRDWLHVCSVPLRASRRPGRAGRRPPSRSAQTKTALRKERRRERGYDRAI